MDLDTILAPAFLLSSSFATAYCLRELVDSFSKARDCLTGSEKVKSGALGFYIAFITTCYAKLAYQSFAPLADLITK